MGAQTGLILYLVFVVGWMLFGFYRLAYRREFKRFVTWAMIICACLLWFHYYPVVGDLLQEKYRARLMTPLTILFLFLFTTSGPFMTARWKRRK
ncbi:hypothetical protein LGV61_05280 [Desulfurispirillum indicum]|uniref:Uncharacterized protein n=1 Tax=Desulfurispirillum indicum (strain ATCC BAA-1389 / DSM 22839 / S5) TaxID=653733 RepID=E6W3G2_DESIS|nr:hypothetical protein [Desulfurispirillum indicum]ADU65755.1 hypothetical protein Selin_1020 [Desulfurispirillum indicum S5]UCZ57688.1 hypothetical protein LGV61_05280 [Desulfurispirillum indicum]